MKEKKKEIYNCLRTNPKTILINFVAGVISMSLFVLYNILFDIPKAYGKIKIVPLILFVVGVLGILSPLTIGKSNKKIKKQLHKIEKSGDFDTAYNDFLNGKQFFNDNLRIGDSYIFSKEYHHISIMKEIKGVKLDKIMVNGTYSSTVLYIPLEKNKKARLANVSSQNNEQLLFDIIDYLKMRNITLLDS